MLPAVLDGNHRDWGRGNLRVARDRGGILAILAKASEGEDWRDTSFDRTVAEARSLGLLVGAYHYQTGSAPGEEQAQWFLKQTAAARAAGPLLLCLDWEREDATPDHARAFVREIARQTGKPPVFYTYQSLLWRRLGRTADPVLGACPLWLAAYGPDPAKLKVQPSWTTWALEQYTNGGDGPRDQARFPRKTPGFGPGGAPGGCDRSVFNGTAEDLRTWWALAAVAPDAPRRTVSLGDGQVLSLECVAGEHGPAIRVVLDPGGPEVEIPAALVPELLAHGSAIAGALAEVAGLPSRWDDDSLDPELPE